MLKRTLSRRASMRAIEPIDEELRSQNIEINHSSQRTNELITHDEFPERGSQPRQSSSSRSNSRVRSNVTDAPQMSRKVEAVRASQKLTRRASFGGNYQDIAYNERENLFCFVRTYHMVQIQLRRIWVI